MSMGKNRQGPPAPVEYEIKVRGKLDSSWSQWFSGLTILDDYQDSDPGLSTLKGILADQAALRGILTRLWDMNLEIITVKQIPSPDKDKSQHDQ